MKPGRWRPRRRTAVLGGLALVVVAGGGGVWAATQSSAKTTDPTELTATAASAAIDQTVSATGTITPATESDLVFPVSGTVTSVRATVGQVVAKGAVLATVDPTSLRTAVDTAQAGVDAAQTTLTAQESAGATATQIASAEAQLAQAQSALTAAQDQVTAATMTSPIAGTVAVVNLTEGEAVTATGTSSAPSGARTGGGGATSVGATTTSSSSAQIVVISTGSWLVTTSVGSADLAQVTKGLQAQMTLSGSTTKIFGLVSSVGIVASSSTSGSATFPVTIKVTGSPAGLYDGASATVSIIVKAIPDVLTIPTASITTKNSTSTVTKVVGGSHVTTTVTLGETYGAQTQVLSGIQAGDVVLIPTVGNLRRPTGTTGRNRTGSTGGGFGGGGFGGTGGGFGGGGFGGTGSGFGGGGGG